MGRRPVAHHTEVNGVRVLTVAEVRDVLCVAAMNAELGTLPKLAKGLYNAEVVALVKKVRNEARTGWAAAIRVAVALYEKRLP